MAQGVYDAAIIFFICFQPIDQWTQVSGTGNPYDMWSASATTFTALIFVVHFNVFTRMKYITIVHWMSVVGTSIGAYLVYMWISNYLPEELS